MPVILGDPEEDGGDTLGSWSSSEASDGLGGLGSADPSPGERT